MNDHEQDRSAVDGLRKQADRLGVLLTVMGAFSTQLKMDALLQVIMGEITRVMEADRSTLFLLDEQTQELWSKVAQGDVLTEIRFPRHLGIAGHVATSGEILNIPEAYEDPRFNQEVDKKTGYRTKTILCMPLKNQSQKIVGAVQVLNKQYGVFTAEDEELLAALGSQAAIALENAALTEQLHKRIQRNELLLDVMHSFSSQLQRDSLLQVIMEKITRAMVADRSTLFLVDRKTNELFSRIAQGENVSEIRFPKHLGIAGHVATSGEILNIPEAYDDPRFNQEVDKKTGYRTKTILCMSIRGHEGAIIGVIQVLNKRQGVFTSEDEELLAALSSQAAVALENSNLFEEVLDMKNYNESILRDMATGVVTLDEEGIIAIANPAATRIFGLDSTGVAGLPFASVLNKEDNHNLVEAIKTVLATGEKYSGYELKYILPGGQDTLSINVHILPLKNARGKDIGLVMVVEDITQEQKMMSTLSRYVDRGVAEQLIKNKDSLKLGGTRQRVTILFSDIRSFTTLSERHEAEEIVGLLNDYFSRMINIIFTHGGTLDKFIGDAIMAVFGAPVKHGDDPLRAVKAAIDMRKELKAFNAERRANGKVEIDIGIGIGYGDVLSGNIGSEQRMDYTVIGDTVNLSSRLEGLTKNYPQKILISDTVYEDVKDKVPCIPLEAVKVKGKEQETEIYGIDDDVIVSE